MSICQRRSCAVTKPCAKNKSCKLCAEMFGTPSESRVTITGAVRPESLRVPSTTGKDAFDARKNHTSVTTNRNSTNTTSTMTTRNEMLIRRLGRGGETMVEADMETLILATRLTVYASAPVAGGIAS